MTIETVTIPGDGERALGLIPFDGPTSFVAYASSGPLWTLDQIVDTITASTWTPAEGRFGDDWIKDQDGRGACAGYAGASLVERCRDSRGLARVELSGDGLYAAVNGGRDAGSALESNMRFMTDHGVPPASLVPRHEYRKNRIPAEAYTAGRRFRAFESYFVDSELGLASALAAGFFAAIAVHAGNGGRSPDGLIDWQNGSGNHSVVCDDVRFRNGRLEFQIANSWGLRWGARGRGWLTWRDHLSNPNRYHRFYVARSAIDDPEGDNPPAPSNGV